MKPLQRLLIIILLPVHFITYDVVSQVKPYEIPLWQQGAPGFEDRKNEPEQAEDWWVKNIHNPSITVYLPPEGTANGTSVIVCPGGGHNALVFNSEGHDAAIYLNGLGITAFVLKYRLAREENSLYKLDIHPRQDALRAMRLVRSKAKEWKLNPGKIGMLGFSAGGEVVATVAYESGEGNNDSADPVEKFNGRPDFQMLIYPGPLGVPASVSSDAPPAFVLAANDDECCVAPAIEIMQKYMKAGASVEGHFYARGGHGFNMGFRTDLLTVKNWPARMKEWLEDYIIDKN